MSENHEYLKCPFCGNQRIEAVPGITRCQICNAQFEIDDRLECIFSDTENIRLPLKGIVCSSFGLVQNEGTMTCLYCGTEVKSTLQ